jgi:amidase
MEFQNLAAMQAALRERRISARELLEEALARVQLRDVELHAVVVRDFERARAAADAADAALARGDTGALLGIPMTVKESFHVAGLPTTWGVPGTSQLRARFDAVVVARLKAAGAIVFGKTNVSTHLGDWQSVNAVYGRTCNPWDLARTPGGSSGGAAAALAAGFVPLEVGSDIAGSLRIPAHCCGVYAHKPSYGLVPMRGHAPPGVPELSIGADNDLAVAGPMARSARDLAHALDVIAGPDDAQAIAYRLDLPRARHERLEDFRVLVLTEHPRLPLSSEVSGAIEGFTQRLASDGCKVKTSSELLPDLGALGDTFTELLMSFLGATFPEAAYRAVQARAARNPRVAEDENSVRNHALVASHRAWFLANRARVALAHQWRLFFRDFDLVLCPVLPTTAFPHDDADMDKRRISFDGKSIAYASQAAWVGPASVNGLPATSLPIGPGASGLPIGIQAIGPYLEDRTPIRFAQLAEHRYGGFIVPPRYLS